MSPVNMAMARGSLLFSLLLIVGNLVSAAVVTNFLRVEDFELEMWLWIAYCVWLGYAAILNFASVRYYWSPQPAQSQGSR